MKIWMIGLMLALLLPACVVRGQTGESEIATRILLVR